jgi:hypothetical protein
MTKAAIIQGGFSRIARNRVPAIYLGAGCRRPLLSYGRVDIKHRGGAVEFGTDEIDRVGAFRDHFLRYICRPFPALHM